MATFVQDDSIQGTTTIITEIAATAPVYAYTSDLNSLSTNSILGINNINATSTTIFNNLLTKENALTFSSPLTRTTNNIGIDLAAYSTTATNNATYLKLTGGTLTGTLTTPYIYITHVGGSASHFFTIY